MPAEGKASDGLPRPGPIGRSVRIVLGAVLLYFLADAIIQISAHPSGFLAARSGWEIPGGDWWAGALVCIWALPLLVNSGFGHRWGRGVRGVYLVLIGAALIWDRTVHGGVWALPLAVLVLLLIVYVLAHAGISYIVAAIAATPG
jgi:hypothetical protein